MGLSYNPSIIDDGLTVYLDAANTSSYAGTGTTWYDLMRNRNFTLQNTPAFLPNTAGGSFSFVPSSSHYATASSLSTLSNWTIELWHYYTGSNTGACPTLITEVYPGSNGKINFNLGCTTANYGSSADLKTAFFDGAWRETANYTLSSGNWYQIVGTYDLNNIKMYINGVLQRTSANTNASTSSAGGINLMKRWDLGDYWGGYLSTVKIYNRALDSGEILQNYNASKGRYGL
jgi:hypothetical protein